MKHYSLLVSFFWIVSSLTAVGGEQGKKDLEKIQGTWIVKGFGQDGVQVEKLKGADLKGKVVITENKLGWFVEYQMGIGKDNMGGTIKLDPTKKPNAIDLDVTWFDYPGSGKVEKKGKEALPGIKGPLLGIYEANGDDLKIAFSRKGTRPTSFAAKQGVIVFVLKRSAE